MTEPDFPEDWIIRSSTSRFFPAHSKFKLKRTGAGSADFELEVTWEKQAALRLIEEKFLPDNGALKGAFLHPKVGSPEDQEEFQLVVTLCPASFEDKKHRMFGLLTQIRGREPGSTGVWVAEEQQPPKPPKR